MTLILACLTEDAVYQVSDRRLTSIYPPYGPIDDEANKAVLWNSCLSFGYTGFSQINGQPTDYWLTSIIAKAGSESNIGVVAEQIRQQATIAFKGMNLPPHYKRHAFQVAGWYYTNIAPGLQPGIVVVDNFLDPVTGTHLSTPLEEFKTSSHFPRLRNGFALHSIGYPLSNNERKWVAKLVSKSVRRHTTNHLAVLQALMAAMDGLADKHATIGKSLMLMCLPKAGVVREEETGEAIVIAGRPKGFAPTSMYRTATGSTSYYGPIAIMAGVVFAETQILTPYDE